MSANDHATYVCLNGLSSRFNGVSQYPMSESEIHTVRETRGIPDTKTNDRIRGLLSRQRNLCVSAESCSIW
jgi:hypothetical protein